MTTKAEILDYCRNRIKTLTSENCSDKEKEFCVNVLNDFITNLEGADINELQLAKIVYLANYIYNSLPVQWIVVTDIYDKKVENLFCSNIVYKELRNKISESTSKRRAYYLAEIEPLSTAADGYDELCQKIKEEIGGEFYNVTGNNNDDVQRFMEIMDDDFLNIYYIRRLIYRKKLSLLLPGDYFFC